MSGKNELKSKISRSDPVLPPAHRRLQILALDPAADEHLETSHISRAVIQIPWEGRPCYCDDADEPQHEDSCTFGQPVPELLPGPCGEYIEVIDVDPSSNCVYDPVDLNDPLLLARDGHAPSIGNPQFHQQMVYAVAMRTIANFERVLGRAILWSDRIQDEQGRYLPSDQRFVQRLRIYPHALREENAYYSPVKKALLFGYFNATTNDPRDELPGAVIFTCLSHDIVAHEVTHAIIDGMHRRLIAPSNGDMLAFHEAFADIVAIFQHFTLPGLLLDQIKRSRGDLRLDNLLAHLASQFARATGRGQALRNAIGRVDEKGRQVPPDPADIKRTVEPHARGAILVAAVFDAFLSIYEHRVRDLYRIATNGTGVLPAGDIHPDLAQRLAEAAANTAQRVLDICIRTLDYLPPVDVNFGDFLRALITADLDFHPEDPHRYRLAFIDGFRRRGIVPRDVRALGEDSLRWNRVECSCWNEVLERFLPPAPVLRAMASIYDSPSQLADLKNWRLLDIQPGSMSYEQLQQLAMEMLQIGSLPTNERHQSEPTTRSSRHQAERLFAQFFWFWIMSQARLESAVSPEHTARVKECLSQQLGLDLEGLLAERDSPGYAPLEVHAVRPTVRRRADGTTRIELLVMLTQGKTVSLQPEGDDELPVEADGPPLRFKMRGGCTLLIDPDAKRVSYAICKVLPSDEVIRAQASPRLERQREYIRGQLVHNRQLALHRFALTPFAQRQQYSAEPFALVHRHDTDHAGF
ncbi:hypothetical protein NA78x_003627 [Anatilimnocola sp. NA78]|uniref:hypothetical protein n=1 Tax=Anatilimnocola sp. NA78 TaxID=3415683 RepID=UPI003CE44E4F